MDAAKLHSTSGGALPGAGGWLLREPRPVAGLRALRTTLRTLHLVAMAVLFGGHVHGVEAARLLPALLATLASGGALMAIEVWRAPVWLVQVRGAATVAKIGLVTAVAWLWDWRVLLLGSALVIGAVVSHMPGRWRYHSLLHGRPVGPQERG